MPDRRNHRPRVSTRWLALSLAAVVLGLGLLSVAPTAHEHLHGHEADHGEHSCAIVLFAQGVTLAGCALALATGWQRLAAVALAGQGVWVAAPARRLPPACGPPRG